MLRHVFTISAILLLLLAQTSAFARSGPTFHGILLPSPRPVHGASAHPPGAWLIIGRRAIPATFGSFCYQRTCMDTVAPQMMPHVSTAVVPKGVTPVMVVNILKAKSVRAMLTPWQPGSGKRPHNLKLRSTIAGAFVLLTLPRLGGVRDDVLAVSVQLAPRAANANPHVTGGDADYLWRINPR